MKCFIFFCLVASLASTQAYTNVGFVEDVAGRFGSKIIQGQPAVYNQFPHQAFLIISTSRGDRSSCGAALIDNLWVVTAAHCIVGYVSAIVHLGSTEHASSPVKITTTNLHSHPDYNPNFLYNDIGLIGFESDVTFGSPILTIAIPTDVSQTYEGRVATVSGFGFTSNVGTVSPTLNFVNLTIISNTNCSNVYGDMVIASTICGEGIISPSQGACNGDSGGPLVFYDDKAKPMLIGVVSFVSTAGCSAAYPSGFVRPYHFISWISSITGPLNTN